MYLTHIDENGNDSPPILIENATAANRAVNLPEFVNIAPDGIEKIDSPASDIYRLIDQAYDLRKNADPTGALSKWKQALEMDPEDARVNYGMGYELQAEGRSGEAIPYFKKATNLSEKFIDAEYGLGAALFHEHQVADAIAAWEGLIRQDPNYTAALEGLGYAYYLEGNYKAALTNLRLALDNEPDRVPALTLTASLLATCPDKILRDGPEAVALAVRAKELTHEQDVAVLDTLSASYAETGHFEQAIETAKGALELALKEGDSARADRVARHLRSYEARTPLRDSAEESTM
jgi:tetratricopeptide (TPR) repeat protein